MNDDTISRQAAIDAMRKHEIDLPAYAPREVDVFWNDAIDFCCDAVEALPSAEPEVRTQMSSADCISRQAVLKLLAAMPPEEATTKAMLIQNVKQMDAAQPEQRWTPVAKRPPKVREWVLCQSRAGIMGVLRLTEDGSWNQYYPNVEYMGGFVVAWMPLPEPYRGEEP